MDVGRGRNAAVGSPRSLRARRATTLLALFLLIGLGVVSPVASQEATPVATLPQAAGFTGPVAPEPEPEPEPLPFAPEVPIGTRSRISLATSESFVGVRVETPVIIVRGQTPGPMLCLTAGVHGDELNGVETVRRLSEQISPNRLSGTVVALPIVNPQGFRRSSRYLPDRRDLNRFFPGQPRGSAASRIAFSVFDSVIKHCEYLIDFHTGSFHRTNAPQLRGNLGIPAVLELAQAFSPSILIHNVPREGTLRRAAVDTGIPAVAFEAGEPMRIDPAAIDQGIEGVYSVMRALGMREGGPDLATRTTRMYKRAHWVRVDEGGILLTSVALGSAVEVGDLLGTVTDPIEYQQVEVRSPYAGRVIGMALSQVVIPGFASFRIGVEGWPGVGQGGPDSPETNFDSSADNDVDALPEE